MEKVNFSLRVLKDVNKEIERSYEIKPKAPVETSPTLRWTTENCLFQKKKLRFNCPYQIGE